MLKKYDMNLFYSSIARLSIVCPAAKAVQFSRGFLVKKNRLPCIFPLQTHFIHKYQL